MVEAAGTGREYFYPQIGSRDKWKWSDSVNSRQLTSCDGRSPTLVLKVLEPPQTASPTREPSMQIFEPSRDISQSNHYTGH